MSQGELIARIEVNGVFLKENGGYRVIEPPFWCIPIRACRKNDKKLDEEIRKLVIKYGEDRHPYV